MLGMSKLLFSENEYMILNFKMLVKFDLWFEKLFTGLQKINTTINVENILIKSLKFETANQTF